MGGRYLQACHEKYTDDVVATGIFEFWCRSRPHGFSAFSRFDHTQSETVDTLFGRIHRLNQIILGSPWSSFF